LRRALAAGASCGSVGFLSFDPATCAACAAAFPGHPVLVNVDASARGALSSLIAFAREHGLHGVSLGWRGEASAHDAGTVLGVGLAVAAWTINDPADARAARAAGVGWLMTDDPAGLQLALEEGR
jgi:glycerophosphoryl diester phosphodiesterase